MEFINQSAESIAPHVSHNIIGAANIFGADSVVVTNNCVWFHFGKPGQPGHQHTAMTVHECTIADSPAALMGTMFRQQLDRVDRLLPKA